MNSDDEETRIVVEERFNKRDALLNKRRGDYYESIIKVLLYKY
jgi:hypothetical protein